MLLYAQTSARRTRQILADLTAAVVLAGAVWFAMAVHEAIMRLAEPGRKVENAGDGLAGSLADAGRSAWRDGRLGDRALAVVDVRHHGQ
ncbi:hypothetical protein AB0O29_35410, partial [Streptomyces sp. NPDC089915]